MRILKPVFPNAEARLSAALGLPIHRYVCGAITTPIGGINANVTEDHDLGYGLRKEF